MNSISPEDLKSKIDNKEDFQLIDLREDYEFETFNIGGVNISMDTVFGSLDRIERGKPVVFMCSSGKKSKAIIHTIKRNLQLDNVYSLEGGIAGYAAKIDI